MVRRRPTPPVVVLAALASLGGLGAGCKSRSDLDGSRPAPRTSRPARRAAAEPVVSLVDNRAAAVAVAGGRLTVSGAGARLVPYIDGNLRAEWALHQTVDGERAALVRGRIANLYVPLDDDPHGVLARETIQVAMRFRPASTNQVVSVFVNEKRIGELAFGDSAAWAERSISVPRDLLRAGENRVRLFFRHLGELAEEDHTPGALGWITIGGTKPASPVAQPQRGVLEVPAQTRASFYVRVPAGRPLLVGTASGEGSIHVASGAGFYRELWSGAGGSLEVPLTDLAGEVVRLDVLSAKGMRWMGLGIAAGSASGDASRAPQPPPEPPDHIIVWSVSSLRADRITDKTSHFVRARRRGLAWTHAFSPAPSPGLAHAAVLTGRPRPPVAGQGVAVAEVLRKQGYATALISGNGFITREWGFGRGFDVYHNPMRLRRPHSARVLWQLARRFLSRHKNGKTFLYIATSEPHLPYTPSAESVGVEWGARPQPLDPAKTAALSIELAEGKTVLTGEQRAFVRALYDAEVRDADAAFGSMLADLDELDLRSRTAVVLFGDHGEELFEHGQLGHGLGLGDEEVRVPLIALLPGASAQSGTLDSTATLSDLFPTLLELGGADAIPSAGRSLFGARDRRDESRALVFRTGTGVWALREGERFIEARGGDVQATSKGAEATALELRYLRHGLSFAVAFDAVWTPERWGSYTNHAPGFAADQGL